MGSIISMIEDLPEMTTEDVAMLGRRVISYLEGQLFEKEREIVLLKKELSLKETKDKVT